MSWIKKLGMGVKTALGSTLAVEIAGTLAKGNGEVPDVVVNGAKVALQLLILYRMANSNPDGTPATTPYEPKKTNKSEGK